MTFQSSTKHSFCRYRDKWLHMMFVCVLMLMMAIPAAAQVYGTSYQPQSGYISSSTFRVNSSAIGTTAMGVPVYTPYQSTVYEPFSSVTPMQRAGRPGTPGGSIGGDLPSEDDDSGDWIPDDFGNVADPGDPTPLSGELWVLLIFAALATIFKAIKLRKQEIE